MKDLIVNKYFVKKLYKIKNKMKTIIKNIFFLL